MMTNETKAGIVEEIQRALFRIGGLEGVKAISIDVNYADGQLESFGYQARVGAVNERFP